METTNQPVQIDLKRILARLANDVELLCEMIEIYREDYPGLMQRIRSAVAQRNKRELEQAAHAIKGLISNFLHDPTTALALKLERKGRSDEWDEIDSDCAELETAAARLLEALDSLNSPQ